MSDDSISLIGKLKEKLIQRKQEWARDGRLLTGRQTMADRTERLPAGQRLVTDWPVLDLGIQPDVPTEAWSLTVDGLVEKTPGGKNVMLDLVSKTIGPVIEALKDLYLNYRSEQMLMIKTIQTQLEAAKWPDYSKIKAME